MVLEQIVASTSSRNLLMIPPNPSSKPQKIPSLIQSANLFPASTRSRCFRKQWKGKWNGWLKCSMDDYKDQFYGNSSSYNQVAYPKPSEIPWKKEFCNLVNLIGLVAAPVEIKHFPSGKVVAWTRLAVKKNSTQTSWINLTFWDELAHVAFQHVEKGHQIYVSGRLVTDTVESDEGKQQTYYKVVGQQLNFIDRSLLPVSSHDHEPDSMMAGESLGGREVASFQGQSMSQASTKTYSGRKGSYAANNTGSMEELWQAFFANPVEWWDNRKNKRNPKYPDFKHKDTGEALWVEGRSNPPWVKSQLAILDTQMGSRVPANMVAADERESF